MNNMHETRKIKELGNDNNPVQTGPFGAELHSRDYVKHGIPLILIRNVKNNYLDEKDIPKITIKDAQRLVKYSLKEGDIVFTRVGRVGSCFLALEKHNGWIISGQTLRIRPNPSKINSKYLTYALQQESVVNYLSGASVGSTRTSINSKILEEISISYFPLPEQEKIAEILSGIDEFLEKIKNQILKLQNLHKGLVSQFLSVGINDGIFNERNVDSLPNAWCIKKLEEVTTFRRGSFPQPYGRAEWYDVNGYPFVQVYDIDENYKLKSNTKARISELAAKKSVFTPKGSLIVSIQGSIGRVAITQYDAYVDRTILIFRNFENHFDKRFLSILIKELFLQQGQIADGGVIKTITKQTLREFKVKKPPLFEQKKISEILSTVESNIEFKKRKLLKIQKTKQSLMQDLFNGRKRVKV